MRKIEKRKKQRISSIHLLNYVSLNQNYQEVGQGMGRTINMSETGLLIETPYAINPEHFLSLNVGLAEERFNVHGQVVYTTPISTNSYRTGIRFNQAPKTGYYVFQNLLNSLNKEVRSYNKDSDKLTLSPVPLLKGPPCDYLYVVEEETYLPDEKIVSQGNYGNWVWVVLDGWATILRETPKGDIAVFKVGPGGFIGSSMSYLVNNYARSNSVIASGTIQLGLLDTQQMISQHASLSPEFKDILVSMSGRLKRIVDRIVLLRQGQTFFKEDLLNGELLSSGLEDNESGLHHITRGKATLLHRNVTNEIPLVNLYPGDYVGTLPFINDENESNFLVARASTGFQKKELHRGSLKTEFENLSQTMKNMIEFSSLKMISASHTIERLSTSKSQFN